jgi:hypothetical protein
LSDNATTLRERGWGVNEKHFPSDPKVVELTGFVAGRYDATMGLPTRPRDERRAGWRPLESNGTGRPGRLPGVACPTCRTRVGWVGNRYRPFCSETCRLIDLGVWLDERYRIAGRRGQDDPDFR